MDSGPSRIATPPPLSSLPLGRAYNSGRPAHQRACRRPGQVGGAHVGKNILIFSDGTGQAGGYMPDEARTNVYKLFRAARVSPDSRIDPKLQLAFYDGGLGSRAHAEAIKITPFSPSSTTCLSKATGLGITQNIIDCYAEIIRVWQPGDRIYLFGFSRGAYTVRCVGGVLKYCGVPTAVRVGRARAAAAAGSAIRATHRHRSRQARLPARWLDQGRSPLASSARKARSRFRHKYFSGDSQGLQHRALFHRRVGYDLRRWAPGTRGLPAAGLSLFRGCSAGLALGLQKMLIGMGRSVLPLLVLGVGAPASRSMPWPAFATRGAGEPGQISPGLLRHAAELRGALRAARARPSTRSRASSPTFPWDEGACGQVFTDQPNAPARFKQVWFAGSHSDIGGSYPETSRAYPTSPWPGWFEEATEPAQPDPHRSQVLNLYPDPARPPALRAQGVPGRAPALGWCGCLRMFVDAKDLGWRLGPRPHPSRCAAASIGARTAAAAGCSHPRRHRPLPPARSEAPRPPRGLVAVLRRSRLARPGFAPAPDRSPRLGEPAASRRGLRVCAVTAKLASLLV